MFGAGKDGLMLQCGRLQTKRSVQPMLELGTKFLLAYFVGSLMGSLIVGRLRGGVDIRKMGSGNAGGTNALRTQGWLFALGVMIIDVGKGVVGAGIIPGLELPFIETNSGISRTWLTIACATAVVIGHVWPMWHQFRGGKGAATLIGTLVVLAPSIIAPVLGVWMAVLTLSGYVGLSTMSAGLTAPVVVAMTRLPDEQPLFIYCAAMSLYLVFSHRSNIRRMLDGKENQVTKVMLFRKSS